MKGLNNNWGLSNVLNTTEYDYGYLVETSGAFYFIPKNCSNSTNTIVFSHGGGGDAHDWEPFLKTNQIDAIYAVPKSNLSYNNYDISQQMLTTDISSIQNSLGITNDNLFTIEHSAGGPSSIYFAAQNIKNNPNIGLQTCVFIDPANGAGNVDPEFLANYHYSDLIQTLGNNHANIIGIENTNDMNKTLSYYQILGNAGCNVMVVKMKGFYTDPHVEISQYAFNKGMVAYLAGNKTLEDVLDQNVDTIKIYDASTGSWKDGTMADISGYVGTIIGSHSNFNSSGEYHSNVNFDGYADTVKSLKDLDMFTLPTTAISNDEKLVYTSMNDLRTNIKNTSLIQGGCKSIGCKSTTIVPTCAENFIHDYFDVVLNLMDKLSKETQNVVNISKGLIKTDEELAIAAEQMVGIVASEPTTVYVPVGGGTSSYVTSTVSSQPKSSSISSSESSSSSQNTATTPVENTKESSSSEKTTESTTENNAKKRDIELKPYSANSLLNKNISERVYDITAEDLNRLFESWADRTGNHSSPLLGTGEAWIKACDEVDLDPLVLVGICGEETGRGGFHGMDWMNKKNFFGMRYIDPTGDGTGNSVKWAGTNDVFSTVDEAVLASAKRIKNFYAGQYGGNTVHALAHTGYTGYSDKKPGGYEMSDHYANVWASIMKESLDYITGTNGGV